MRFRIVFLSLAVLCAAAGLRAEDLGGEFYKEGVACLREAASGQDAQLLPAAEAFGKAALLFEATGQAAQAQTANALLFWCRKHMTAADIDAYTHSAQDAAIAKKLDAAAAQPLDQTLAQTYLERAEAFAKAEPNEHLLISLRFYEVAERFAGSPVSAPALERSLKEMQAAAAAKSAAWAAELTVLKTEKTNERQAVPDAAAQKKAEIALRQTFEEAYAKTEPTAKLALAQQLLKSAEEGHADDATQFVTLREARELAIQAGEGKCALQAVYKIAAVFKIDKLTEAALCLEKTLNYVYSTEQEVALTEEALSVFGEAVAADDFERLRSFVTVAEQAAARSLDKDLTARVRVKSAWAAEMLRDWPVAKAALAKLQSSPDDGGANLTVGRFYCLTKADWPHGLPALAHSSDASLKALAEKELAKPGEAALQAAVGDGWWDVAQKQAGPVKTRVAKHAVEWYEKALPKLSGTEKNRVAKRVNSTRPFELVVEAFIDGESEFHVTANTVYWKENGMFKPGRLNGRNLPTYLNGEAWIPVWGNPKEDRGFDTTKPRPMLWDVDPRELKCKLLAIGETHDTVGMMDRDSIKPHVEKGEFVVTIPDTQGGAFWYRVRIFASPP